MEIEQNFPSMYALLMHLELDLHENIPMFCVVIVGGAGRVMSWRKSVLFSKSCSVSISCCITHF